LYDQYLLRRENYQAINFYADYSTDSLEVIHASWLPLGDLLMFVIRLSECVSAAV
jgi:hypothetical protein